MLERLFTHTHDWFALVPPPGDDGDPRPCVQFRKSPFQWVTIRYGAYKMLDQQTQEGMWPVQYEWTLVAYPADFDLTRLETTEFRDLMGQVLLALMEERAIAIERMTREHVVTLQAQLDGK